MQNSVISNLVQHIRQTALATDYGSQSDGKLLDLFLTDGDESAFTVLVHRHGAMVFGVCQRILSNVQDAEDAFQATFLIVVLKASELKKRQTIGNWLYGVACNTALKARLLRQRRQEKEKTMAKHAEVDMQRKDKRTDVATILDEALRGLPDKYREPIILCDMEGKTRKEAAHQLGWPEGTVAGRLARGRILLANRLKRHGVNLASGSVAMLVSREAVSAQVPASLFGSTIETVQAVIANVVDISDLAKSVLRDLTCSRIKKCLAYLCAFAVVTFLVVGFTYATGGTEPMSTPAKTTLGQIVPPKEKADAKLINVWSVAFSPNGEYIASASLDGTVRIWNMAGEVTRELKGHRGAITSVDWSPDGKRLASAGFDGTVRIWNTNGTLKSTLNGHNGVVGAVAWSANGKHLASAGFGDNTVRIWNADGTSRAVLRGHSRRVHTVAWHPRGNALASGSYDGTVRLWDANGRPYGPRVLKGGGGIIYSVAWSGDGNLLAAGNHNGTIGLWDMGFAELAEGAEPITRIRAHESYVLCLSWSPDSKVLASAGADKRIRGWSARTNFKQSLFEWKGHGTPEQPGNRYNRYVHSVSWNPDGNHVVSGGMDGTIRLWNVTTGKAVWIRDSAGVAQ